MILLIVKVFKSLNLSEETRQRPFRFVYLTLNLIAKLSQITSMNCLCFINSFSFFAKKIKNKIKKRDKEQTSKQNRAGIISLLIF